MFPVLIPILRDPIAVTENAASKFIRGTEFALAIGPGVNRSEGEIHFWASPKALPRRLEAFRNRNDDVSANRGLQWLRHCEHAIGDPTTYFTSRQQKEAS